MRTTYFQIFFLVIIKQGTRETMPRVTFNQIVRG